ncbi:MAG TPA: efflux RND transporter permease subunit, partial [Sphingomonadaceae bacterium]|nr:efflux RND transporter permease subunit [Sphingomonadaceae bacterium]
GLTGALFKEFAFTLAGAVIVSGVVALTLSPVMSSLLLKSQASEGRFAHAVEHRMERLTAGYSRLLDHTLAARPIVLMVGGAALIAIVILFSGAKRELSPIEDQGYVYVQLRAPQYASLDYTMRYTREVEKIFHTMPEYSSSFFNTGGPSGVNNAFGGIHMKEWSERSRSADEVQSALYAAGSRLDGVRMSAFQPPALPASSGGLPVQMVLRSPADFSQVYEAMETVKAAARKSGLFVFVDSDLAFDAPEARIVVDQAKAGEIGVTMKDIADTLALLVGENYVNRFNFHDRSYDVIAQVRREDRLTPDNLGDFYVKTASGALVPLATVVRFEMRPQANRLPQFNQMNAATLSAVPAPGVTMGQAVTFLQSQPLPPGATIDWLGDSRQYVEEGNRLTISFGFALVVIFLVLAAQFESLRDPLVILVTVPLAVCGALLPLYLGYTTLNIYTQIGLVTLIGLISKHGILMTAFANDLQLREGLDRVAAIRKASAIRMRPILMTTAAMVTGLIPLLFADGAGARSRFAIGIVVVMGMLIGTLFTLFVLPTIYTFVARDHRASAASARERELADLKPAHA